MSEVIEFDGNVSLHAMLWGAGITVYQIETDKPRPGFKQGKYHVAMTPIEEERDMGPSWDDASDWEICKTQNKSGLWYWWNMKPSYGDSCILEQDVWVGIMPWQGVFARGGYPNPNWRDTLEMRLEPEQDEQLCVCDTMSISTSEETMDLLRFRISTQAVEEMLISEDLILINGDVAAPDEVVAFLKRLAERNAREQSNG